MKLNRLSLNVVGLNRIGLNRIGSPSRGSSSGTDRPYIDPEVLASLKAVCICYGKSNDDPDRAIVKNLVDPDNPFIISNAAYKLNSGYGKYEEDFTSWIQTNGVIVSSDRVQNSILGRFLYFNTVDKKEDVPTFKVNIKLGEQSKLQYNYIREDGTSAYVRYSESGIYTIPASYFSKYTGGNAWFGFYQIEGTSTIEQIPSYQGAFVTGGVDDEITSTKTMAEMLDGSNECTVLSMIANLGSYPLLCNSNYSALNAYNIRNALEPDGVISILGYTDNNGNVSNINSVMGDKNSIKVIDKLNYNSEFTFIPAGYYKSYYKTAWYWTVIANKVLTTDQINQVIAYYNLDRCVEPTVLYDVKRQGLTNDTPAADWYLKDFSGNGHDMQLYNFAKSKDSGIGKYAEDFTTWSKYSNVVVTKDKITVTDKFNQDWLVYKYSKSSGGISPMRIKITGIPINARIEYRYAKTSSDTALSSFDILEDGVYDIPESFIINNEYSVGFKLSAGNWTHIEITQIPDYEGALVSDGKDDYGHADNLPIFKDYTVAADYARLSYGNVDSAIISKSYAVGNGAFGFNLASGQSPNNVSAISFGTGSAKIQADDNYRKIRYQSKYVNDRVTINAGNGIDGNEMWLSCLRENNNFSESAFYSMLLFPYSLSEFLLERQLKKYKLGTLYPDMVEWRPKVNINVPVVTPPTFSINNGSDIITDGQYIPEGTEITIRIFTATDGSVEGINEATAKINGIDIELTPSGNKTYYGGKFTISSKQKIDITIDEYIRYEDIVHPYPVLLRFKDENGNEVSWGGKLRVGSTVTYIDHFQNNNLLKELYKVSAPWINNRPLATITEVVERQMIYRCTATWIKDGIAPKCILSPSRLRIPNSSYKILGYVPDLTGKGNHGKLNNFAYTEDSGAAADGSIKFDGTDDHITIPTLAHGGKCVMMKVNWSNGGMLYDQRLNSSTYTFGIYTSEALPAYNARNNGSTYIDGILNTSIIPTDLSNITHNITAVNDAATDNSTVSPRLGVSVTNSTFSNMSLYEFMLFPEIPSEDEIKKLNDVMGIEGGYVESPNCYWDAYGKKNTDTDRNLIADQVSKDVANALEVKNVAYNSESGYNGYIELLFNIWSVFINENRAEIDKIDTTLNITKVYIQNKAIIYCGIGHYLTDIPSKYKITGVDDTHPIKFGNDGYPDEPILTVTKDGEYEVDWYNYGKNPCIMAGFIGDCNITIEQVAQYPNGLVSDGIDDHLINTTMPILTDYTWIVKRKWLDLNTYQTFVHKGAGIANNAAFLFEYIEGGFYTRSFSSIGESKEFPELISYQTKNNYNGTSLTPGSMSDGNQLRIFMGSDQYPRYTKAVFYKAMLYDKTIDQLSINMLKNLFERDELIDVTNPIFKKEEL